MRIGVFILVLVGLVLFYIAWRRVTEQPSNRSHAHTGQDQNRNTASMSAERAREILALPDEPSQIEIIQAHRRLMQKVHPDKGGSPALAQQLNEAKLVLLKHIKNT